MESQEVRNEIQEIINGQIREIDVNYYLEIRNVYKIPYKSPEFQNIKYIICRCITLGFYIPAMTLLNHFLEKFLKFILIYNDNKQNDKIKIETSFQLVDELAECNPKFDDKNLYQKLLRLID